MKVDTVQPFRIRFGYRVSMKVRFIAAFCLFALLALHFAALAGPLLSSSTPDCCAGGMCPMHRPKSSDSSDCHHAASKSSCACAINASHAPPQMVIGSYQPYIAPARPTGVAMGPAASAIQELWRSRSSAILEIEAPPPRPVLV